MFHNNCYLFIHISYDKCINTCGTQVVLSIIVVVVVNFLIYFLKHDETLFFRHFCSNRVFFKTFSSKCVHTPFSVETAPFSRYIDISVFPRLKCALNSFLLRSRQIPLASRFFYFINRLKSKQMKDHMWYWSLHEISQMFFCIFCHFVIGDCECLIIFTRPA